MQGAGQPGAVSLFSVDNPDVVIQTVKRAQNGDGYIVRLHEIAGKNADIVLQSEFLEGATAQLTDLLERSGDALSVKGDQVKVKVAANSLTTLMFVPGN